MRAIGDVIRERLPHTSGEIVVRDRPRLPPAEALSPDKATAVGSRLLEGGQLEAALPYLMRGAAAPTNAFAWRRLGTLCHALGHSGQAVTCFDRSLKMEPAERFGLMGVAKALADWPDATLEELVEATTNLVPLLRGPEPAPVAYVLRRVVRSVAQRCPHPQMLRLADDLGALARHLDVRTGQERLAMMERRLDAVLHTAELVGTDSAGRRGTQDGIGAPPSRAELPRAS